MDKKEFRTDWFTLISYALLVVSYSLFFGALLYRSGKFSLTSVVFLLLVLPVVGYFFFLLKKNVTVSNDGIEVFGITGRKSIRWDEIEEVSLTPGRRFFLFISSKDGKLAVVDDSVSGFEELLREIERRVPNRLSSNFKEIASSYKRSYTSNAIILIASLVLLFILIKSFI